MLQPFEPFKPAFIDRLMRLNKQFIVTQSYKNGDERMDDGSRQKIHLLASDYEELSSAGKHCDALKETDKYASVIHLKLPEHYKKLIEILDPDSRYVLFFAAIKNPKELEKYLNINYIGHMRRWIDKNTLWQLKKDAPIRASLQLIFGVLSIELKYAGHSVKVKFEDLERA
jgi:GTP1/Obg family GTP-binding protein